MSKYTWLEKSYSKFVDQYGTIFTKGPFKFGQSSYEYKLEESENPTEADVDYCTTSQMMMWDIQAIEVLEA